MKPKKLPFIALIWLILLGFDFGFIVGAIVFSYNVVTWMLGFLLLFILILLIERRYTTVFQEWGLTEHRKKKEKKKNVERGSNGKKEND